jgi:hypothetical protein
MVRPSTVISRSKGQEQGISRHYMRYRGVINLSIIKPAF